MAGEPKPAAETHGRAERKIDPGFRPVERAGRAEQDDAEKEQPQHSAADEFPHEVRIRIGRGMRGGEAKPVRISRWREEALHA